MEQTKPTTRAEEIAGDGPYNVRYDNGRYVLDGPTPTVGFWALEEWDAQNHADELNAAYKQGQQDRWIPVAMIHNDYDASVRCSNCGYTGGFGVYDDLEWAKHCPGCGRPISEQVSAKGVRIPHPLYAQPNPEQR